MIFPARRQKRAYILFNHPVQSANLLGNGIVDTNLYHRLTFQGKGIGIMLVFDLLQSLFCSLIELQFYHIDGIMSFHREIGSAFSSMLLYENTEVGEQGEDDVHHLLIMPLVISVVAISNGFQESLEQQQGFIHFALIDEFRHLGNSRISHY